MIANGWLSASDYYRALAETCGVPFRGEIGPDEVTAPASLRGPRECLARGLVKERGRGGAYVFAPQKLRPSAVEVVLARLAPHRLSLASPDTLRQVICGHFAQTFAAALVDGLHARFPDRSAKARLSLWQRLLLLWLLLAFVVALALHAQLALRALSLSLIFIFLPVIALRVFAAYDLLRRAPSKHAPPRIPDAELPIYTILMPLYHEANMLASLTSVLARLDYPAAKLDIKLVLEAVDAETIAAARKLRLPGNVEIAVVPDLHPRTKPKALNYALPLARGEYLVIYDAEDRPERDQLPKPSPRSRKASQSCLPAGEARSLQCLGQLAYGSIHHRIRRTVRRALPALDRLQLPIPLGGTSNHFRVSALKWLMAWDPFTVTEDADLGSRAQQLPLPGAPLDNLRGGAAAAVILVPAAHALAQVLYADLVRAYAAAGEAVAGAWRSGVPGLPGHDRRDGAVGAGASLVLCACRLRPRTRRLPRLVSGMARTAFWLLASLGPRLGYLASMMLGFLALKRRGVRDLLSQVPLMPLYWLLISGAAYRAVWQFATDRFTWEKTAQAWSRHDTCRDAFASRDAPPRSRQKQATRGRALKTARVRGQ